MIREDAKNALATVIQEGVPLVPRPFAALGARVGLTEADALDFVRLWQGEGLLREISAVLEGSALGYESALVAGKVPEGRLDEVAAIVNAHPTVTHNYLREHAFNLWFTIAAPTSQGLEEHLRILEAQTGIGRFHALRRTHTFKIGVNFNPETRWNETAPRPLFSVAPVVPTERAQALFRALQRPLPLEERPFRILAEMEGTTEGELMEFGRHHLGGAIRRYVGTFRHRMLGVRGNGMVVWKVEPTAVLRLGEALASAPEVSHCYARETMPGFPYGLYSMMHAPDESSCRAAAERLSSAIGCEDFLILFSRVEFKKCRLRYFLPELERWWSERFERTRSDQWQRRSR